MGVRADMTPQVARIDAHGLRRNAPTRLCYCSTALRAKPPQAGGTRLPYQLGVELFGHDGADSDLEVILLLLETLALAGAGDRVVLDLGHVGIFRALVAACDLSEADQAALEDIYLRKARSELEGFVAGRALPDAARRARRRCRSWTATPACSRRRGNCWPAPPPPRRWRNWSVW